MAPRLLGAALPRETALRSSPAAIGRLGLLTALALGVASALSVGVVEDVGTVVGLIGSIGGAIGVFILPGALHLAMFPEFSLGSMVAVTLLFLGLIFACLGPITVLAPHLFEGHGAHDLEVNPKLLSP